MGGVAEYPELKNTTLVKGDEVLLRYSATGLERDVEESWGGRGVTVDSWPAGEVECAGRMQFGWNIQLLCRRYSASMVERTFITLQWHFLVDGPGEAQRNLSHAAVACCGR